jgi:hypothetical protein
MNRNKKYLDGFEKYNRSKSLSPKTVEHPLKPWIETIIEEQAIPSQEELFKK